MLYILCIVFPPAAVLFTGRPFLAVVNLLLCLFLWIPGIVHAFFVVSEYKADRRAARTAALIGTNCREF